MTDVEAAWVAGFLEGEGYFGLVPRRNRSALRLVLNAGSTDRDVLVKLAEIVGGGTILGPFDKGPNTKPAWRWDLVRKNDILKVLHAIRPLMGDRRGSRIDEMIGAA